MNVPAYTYSELTSAAICCGATVKFVDIHKDGDSVTHIRIQAMAHMEILFSMMLSLLSTHFICPFSSRLAGIE